MTEVLSTPLVQTGAILTSRLRVEFAAAHKRFVMFCGPSGAGKSTVVLVKGSRSSRTERVVGILAGSP